MIPKFMYAFTKLNIISRIYPSIFKDLIQEKYHAYNIKIHFHTNEIELVVIPRLNNTCKNDGQSCWDFIVMILKRVSLLFE